MEKNNYFFNSRYINDYEKQININLLLNEKQKSLKDQHFEKYYNHLFNKASKSNNLKTFSLTESSTNTINDLYKNYKSVTSSPYHPIVNIRNFKDPKSINYKLFKYNPYNNLNKLKIMIFNNNNNRSKKRKKNENKVDDVNNIKDINSITFYDIKFNKQAKIKNNDEDLPKNKNNINKNNKKNILNNNQYKDIIDKIKIFNNNEKQKRIKNKIYYQNNVREGYYGKKDTFGIPYFYDTSTIFKNEYANKSEKNRHELLLNELSKLKSYLDRNPHKKLYIIKDFLGKFHIDEIEKYNKKQLLHLCNFISNADNMILSRCLKPYLNIKNMLYDILNNSLDLNNIYFEEKEEREEKEEKEEKEGKEGKEKIDEKKTEENELINNNGSTENNLLENTPKKNLILKEKYYLSPLIKRKKSKFLTQTVKLRRISSLKSGMALNEAKTDNNDNDNNIDEDFRKRKSVILDLNATNSKLKYMIYQKQTFFPFKTFSNENIINEIGKEIRDIENDYNEKLKELELMKDSENSNIFYHRRRNTMNIETKDKLYVNIKNPNKTKLKTLVPIHYSLTKNYNGKMKNLNDIIINNNKLLNTENNIYRKRLLSLDNCCLNSTERKNKTKNDKSDIKDKIKEKSFERAKKARKKTEVIKRLYYIPTRKKFGLQEIRNRLKLTEYIALTHAKKNINKNVII